MNDLAAVTTPVIAPSRRRLVAAGLGAILGTALTTSIVGGVALEQQSPEAALTVMPWNAGAHAAIASKLALMDARGHSGEIIAHAKAALRRDPTEFSAARAIGTVADATGRNANANAAFLYSQQLSRRDLITNIWFIESAVDRNDIPSALQSYDRALRTSKEAAGLLYPVLIPAFDDQQLVGPIVGLLAKNPPWRDQYLASAFDASKSARSLEQVAVGLSRSKVGLSANLQLHLLYRMVKLEAYDEAWTAAAAFEPSLKGTKNAIRDTRFTRAADNYPFGWTYSADEGFGSESVQKGPGVDGGLSVYASAGRQGVVVRQLLMLSPGSYSLSWVGEPIDAPLGSKLSWTLECASSTGGRISESTVQVKGNQGSGSTPVVVPASSCRAQWLSLVARGGDEPDKDLSYLMKRVVLGTIAQ